MTRTRLWSLTGLLTAVLVVAGCGGGGGGGDDGTPLDILSTNPADGDIGVAEDTSVFVVFAADLDPTTVGPDALIVETAMGRVSGTVTYDAATRRLVFTPDDELPLSAPHTARVPAGIRDADGNAATADLAFVFETRPAESQGPTAMELLPYPVISHGFRVNDAGLGMLVRLEREADGTETLRVHHYDAESGFTNLFPIRTSPRLNFDGRGVALGAGGEIAIAWSEYVGGQYDAFVRRFDAGTRTWGPVQTLEANAAESSHGLTVAVTAGGDVLASWYQQVDVSSDADLWARTYTPEAGWDPATIVDGGAGDVLAGHFATSARRQAVLVFAQKSASGHHDVFARRWTPVGGFESVESVEPYQEQSTYPSAPVMDDAGRITVMLTRRETDSAPGGWETLWTAQYVPGSGWQGYRRLQQETGDVSGPKVAMDELGNITVGWGFYSNPYSSYHVARYAAGQGWEPTVEVSPERSGGLKYAKHVVLAAESGRALAFWFQNDPDGPDRAILGSEYVPGSGWSPYTIVHRLDSAEYLIGAVEPSGGAVLAWTEDDPNLADAVRLPLLRVPSNLGTGLVPFAVIAPGQRVSGVSLGLDAYGRGAAAWTQAPIGTADYDLFVTELR